MRLNFTIPDQFPELFSLGRRIGQGRFGTAYLCVENSTGKEYACKLIEKRKLVKDDDLSDLAREIQIMYHLAGHSNVASIKEAYEDSETVRIVMELCKGGQLLDRIKRQGNFAERKAAEIISTIVGVVEYIHSLGVMHRDLKPENFLFVNDQDDSLLKAIDFGLSTFFEPGEKFGDIVGSPYYVAPEVLRRNYGPEADIWSAGVILYILLTGRPPFWEKTEENIFNQVLHGELDLSSDPWPFISENAKDLVRRMIDRNPVSRISAVQVLYHPWIMLNSIGLDRPL